MRALRSWRGAGGGHAATSSRLSVSPSVRQSICLSPPGFISGRRCCRFYFSRLPTPSAPPSLSLALPDWTGSASSNAPFNSSAVILPAPAHWPGWPHQSRRPPARLIAARACRAPSRLPLPRRLRPAAAAAAAAAKLLQPPRPQLHRHRHRHPAPRPAARPGGEGLLLPPRSAPQAGARLPARMAGAGATIIIILGFFPQGGGVEAGGHTEPGCAWPLAASSGSKQTKPGASNTNIFFSGGAGLGDSPPHPRPEPAPESRGKRTKSG